MTAKQGACIDVRCDSCRKEFSARVADRNRGWARFCSKSCAAIKKKRSAAMPAWLADSGRDAWADNIHPFEEDAFEEFSR